MKKINKTRTKSLFDLILLDIWESITINIGNLLFVVGAGNHRYRKKQKKNNNNNININEGTFTNFNRKSI